MFSTGRKRFRRALKNWPFTGVGPSDRISSRTAAVAAATLAVVVLENSGLLMLVLSGFD
jgi:hypothetical protein